MLIHSSFAYLLARGLPGLVNLAALALYSRLLNPEAYGRYAIVIAGMMLVGMVVFQWHRLVVMRWLPARRADQQRFLGENLSLFLGLALAASAIGAVVAILWPDPTWRQLMAVAVPLLVAQSWFELNLTLAQARRTPARYGAMLGGKTLFALGIGASLAWAGLGAFAPLLGLLAGSVLAVALFGLGSWRGVILELPKKGEFSRQLAYGLPLILTFALSWIIASSDRLIIAGLLNVDAAALYAVGYDLSQYSLGVLLAIVNTAAYPLALGALEVLRVLEPRGFLLLSTPYREDLRINTVVCPDCGSVFHKVGHVQSFDMARMKGLLVRHGYLIEEMFLTTFVDWRRRGIRSFVKSVIRSALARLGEGIADPHIVVLSRSPSHRKVSGTRI